MFTQVNDRPEFQGRTCLDIVRDRRFDEQLAMKALARYRIARQSRQEFETLSGGQKARLEILCLELDGHNVLLLDEPTDNLDVDSSEALEQALDGFDGTVIAVSHDRAFLAQLDRFLMITDDGEVFALPDYELAMRALADPDRVGRLRLAEPHLMTVDATSRRRARTSPCTGLPGRGRLGRRARRSPASSGPGTGSNGRRPS